MDKNTKKALVEKMISDGGNYFYLRKIANEIGIKHMTRAEAEGIKKSYLLKKPNMKAYYDDSNNNSFFCGLWFADETMIFENE
jgi:hypothetical protein